MRGAAEVTSLGGKRIAPAGAAAFNPSFDVTPAELITTIVTEAGVLRAPYGPAIAAAIEAREARRPAPPAGPDGPPSPGPDAPPRRPDAAPPDGVDPGSASAGA